MADYKAIKGFTIQEVDGDPTSIEGQVWYNAITGKLKGAGLAAGTWATGTVVNTGRANGIMSGGTYTAAIISGGNLLPPVYLSALTEEWDGSSWTESGDLNQRRDHLTGMGTTTAALAIGGHYFTPFPYTPGQPHTGYPAATLSETYDGSSWTETGDLPAARAYGGACGITTAGLYIGGLALPPISPRDRAETFEYDGTSWTDASADTGSSYYDHGATGTATAAIWAGGVNYTPPITSRADSQTYDGSSWTDAPDINTARKFYNHISGIQTDAIFFGGHSPSTPGFTKQTEVFDGTSWTETTDLNTNHGGGGGAKNHGSSANALAISGTAVPGGVTETTAVEEWTGPAAAVRTFTSS